MPLINWSDLALLTTRCGGRAYAPTELNVLGELQDQVKYLKPFINEHIYS